MRVIVTEKVFEVRGQGHSKPDDILSQLRDIHRVDLPVFIYFTELTLTAPLFIVYLFNKAVVCQFITGAQDA